MGKGQSFQQMLLGELGIHMQKNKIGPLPHTIHKNKLKADHRDFPGGIVVKNPPANAGDTGSIPGPGRSHMPWSN